MVKTFVELPENLQSMSIFPKKYDSFSMEKSFLKNDRRIIKYLIIKYVLFLSNYNLIISIWIRIFIEIIDFRFKFFFWNDFFCNLVICLSSLYLIRLLFEIARKLVERKISILDLWISLTWSNKNTRKHIENMEFHAEKGWNFWILFIR